MCREGEEKNEENNNLKRVRGTIALARSFNYGSNVKRILIWMRNVFNDEVDDKCTRGEGERKSIEKISREARADGKSVTAHSVACCTTSSNLILESGYVPSGDVGLSLPNETIIHTHAHMQRNTTKDT